MVELNIPNGINIIIRNNFVKVNNFLIKKLKNDLSVSDVSKIWIKL